MELGELPMILFTVITQMCVGMFIVLGAVQLLGSTRHSAKAVDRLADPALLAIGPAMVLGLLVSILHMHDVFNMFNVIRHWQTSWLSREILFGVSFAAFGFLFCLLQALKIGSVRMRQVVAVLTAILGIGLVISQAQIYYSLVTVPAWHHPATWVQFFATTLMLGALGVGAAFVLIILRRESRIASMDETQIAELDAPYERGTTGQRLKDFVTDRRLVDSETRTEIDGLLATTVRGIVGVAVLAAGVLLITMPIYISGLANAGPQGYESAAMYMSGLSVVRFALLVLGAFGLGLLAFYYAGSGLAKLRTLALVLVSSFLLVLIGEFLGRALFYEVMVRIGV